SVSGSPFCACDSIIVPFTSVGTFTVGNVYTAQLSDAAGSFAAPVSIGTLLSTANSGNIHCMIPCATPPGNGYRVRVVSSTPALIGNDNGINIIVNSTVTPLVTISASPSGAICAGDIVTFTATETGGGTTPTYQWLVNGANAGTNSSVFSSSTFVNGDIVTCILYSSSTCASPDSAISNAIVLIVTSVITPQVNISASPSGAICVGDIVTFTAAETGGGTTPTYQWLVNGVNAGTNSSTFSSNTFVNGDVVSVILYSSSSCASPDSAVSTEITLLVNTIPTPQIIGDTLVCAGANVMLTASGGSTYIWSTAATTATITVNPLVNSTYTVTAYNGTCGGIATIDIEITSSAVVHAWPDTTIEAGESVQLHSSGGTSWSWFPPGSLSCPTCQNPFATPTTTTSYIVTSIDAGGCVAQDTVTVTVELMCGEVFIPSAFSPNNDGYNDILYVRNNCIEVLEFAIYDRWGNKVFFTDNPEIGWDGKMHGKEMDGGVFVFYLNAMLKDNTTIIRQGNITLIR
ncbi:MAG: gliding motility-associated C-terminal domain-containing protein, partial [Bacteroidota bacterium]